MANKNGKSKKKASAKGGKRDRKAFDKISAHLGDLARPSPLTFDAHGWPEGEAGEGVARAMLELLRGIASEAGWEDQPNHVAFVYRPDVTVADLASAGIDADDAMDTLDAMDVPEGHTVDRMAQSFRIVDFDGEPAWALWNLEVPSTVNALAVTAESWVSRSDDVSLRPSADPDRVDARQFFLLTRTGLLAEALVLRGDDAPLEVSFGYPSQTGVMLHACLGVPIPSDWPRVTAREFVAALAALGTLEAQRREFDSVESDGLSPRQVPPMDVSSAALASLVFMVHVTSDMGALLSKKDNRVLDAGMASDWQALGDDASEELSDLCRRWFSQLTWGRLLSAPGFAERFTWETPMWPFSPVNWAGNDVLEAFAGIRDAPTPEAVLASASKDDASAVMEVLRQVGLSQ